MKHPATDPIAFVIHALLALFFGALGAGAMVVIQLVASGGVTDLRVIVAGGATAFGAYFGAGFILLQKSPETAAAISQVGQEVLSRVDQLQQSHSGLVAQVAQLVGHIRALSAMVANPPTTTVPAVPASAAAQPTPVQIAPNPAFNATADTGVATLRTWNQPVAPLPQAVVQLDFPARLAQARHFGDSTVMPTVQPPSR